MRITNRMMSNNFLRDMAMNQENMAQLEAQLTSGKQYRKPSDDPLSVARGMQMHSSISENKQYNSNIKDTISWLDTTDTALGQVGDNLNRIKELLVSAGNGAYSLEERKKIKDEINEKVGSISQVLNTSFDGKYIFAGDRATSKPMDVKPGTGSNNRLAMVDRNGVELPAGSAELQGKLKVEVSQGVVMDYNVTAPEVLKYGTGADANLSDLLKRITNHLDGNDDDGNGSGKYPDARNLIMTKDQKDMDSAISNLLTVRSQVGSKQNRMETAKGQNEEMNQNMTEVLSKTEDVNFTEKVMEFVNAHTVYMAALQTSAKVIQPTLMDYLR